MSRRPLPIIPYVFIAAFLLGMAVHQAWPTSQEAQQRPNLHTPAPVAGDLLPVVERLEKRVKRLEAKSEPHNGLPAVLPDAQSLEWGGLK